MFPKREPKVIANEVASDIKRAIIKGFIEPGEKINETKIAKDMGISRSPVREALQQLKKEGVVINIPYKGTYVNLLGKKDVEDMYIVRVLLESYAVEFLIKNKDEAIIELLRQNVRDIEKSVEKKQKKELVKNDLQFHRNICNFTKNQRLINIWEELQSQVEILITLESVFYERFNLLAVEHREILSLIVEGKVKQAQEKIKEHIAQALDFLKENLENTKNTNGK
jgi:DNA-binding GntR family transcriptional regulator